MKIRFLALLVLLPFAAHAGPAVRPYAEYERANFLVMSAGLDYQTKEIKRAILTNLPEGVTVILPFKSESERAEIEQALGAELQGKAEFLRTPIIGETLWARDSMPFPLLEEGKLLLVDSPYSGKFEPDSRIAERLGAGLRHQAKEFEHGNLAANRRGDCIVVKDNFANLMEDSVFENSFACRKILRLPFVSGIGHADEVVKFLADDLVLTDHPEWISRFQDMGLRAVALPKAKLPDELARRGVMPQRSYVNSLLINGTVFVPVFGLDTDDEALAVYRAQGLKVVAIPSAYVADYGGGALHCLTMTYP